MDFGPDSQLEQDILLSFQKRGLKNKLYYLLLDRRQYELEQ